MIDPLRNKKDPLHKTGPTAEQELFRTFGNAANDFPREAVISAAMNLVINVLRQEHAHSQSAELAYDEITQKFKGIFLDKHYDLLGNRKNLFPFTQTINVDLLTNVSKFYRA